MSLYTQVATSAVGYRDQIQDPPNLQHLQNNETKKHVINNQQDPNVKPIRHRSRSERSERVMLDNHSPNSSIVAMPIGTSMRAKESSIISISKSVNPFQGMKKKGKASSVISGAELRDPKPKGKKGVKANSVVSDSVYSKVSSRYFKNDEKPGSDGMSEIPTNKVVDEKSVTKVNGVMQNMDQAPREMKSLIPVTGKPVSKYNTYDYDMSKGQKNMIGGTYSAWSDSEVGPSPSEVAAVMAQRRYPLDNDKSSVLDGWSVEGLRSKLERWRMDLPPLYDNSPSRSSYRSLGHHGVLNKRSGSGSALFSCFGNICGYEYQCVCGKPPGRKNRGSRYMTSSVGTSTGRSFL